MGRLSVNVLQDLEVMVSKIVKVNTLRLLERSVHGFLDPVGLG